MIDSTGMVMPVDTGLVVVFAMLVCRKNSADAMDDGIRRGRIPKE